MAGSTAKPTYFDDLLTCSICLETFKKPKYLPCLHTFCETCINSYIISFVEKENKCDGFPCPVCRQYVSYHKEMGNRETYASNLPTNHFVISLLDMKAIQNSEKLCNSCEFNNEISKALSWCTVCEEALCKQCEKCHRSFKMTAKHKIVPLHEIHPGKPEFLIFNSINCEEHPDKIIEVYCSDHSKPCCTLCATLSHRKCDEVISISKAAAGVKQSSRVSDLNKRFACNSEIMDKAIESRKEILKKTECDGDAIRKKVSVFKQEVLDELNKLEEKVKCELDSTEKEISIKLSDEIDKFTCFKSAIQNWKAVFNGCLEYGSNQQCLVELNKISPKLLVIENYIKDSLKKTNRTKFTFTPAKVVEELKNKLETMRNLSMLSSDECREEVVYVESHVDFKHDDIKILHIIDVCGNEIKNSISGVFVDSYIILALRDTKEVIKYSDDGKYLSTLELKINTNIPDISAMSHSRAAVSSESNAILIIDTTNMTVMQTLMLQSIVVQGLSFVKESGSFIVGNTGSLTWINANSGKRMNQRRTKGNSFFVTSLNKGCYVSGDGHNAVSCFQGNQLKFNYVNLELSEPRGIGVDFKGNLYIAGYDSSTIHQITKDGKLIRIIPSTKFGIESPWTIRFAPDNSKFLVSCNRSGKVSVCDFVSI